MSAPSPAVGRRPGGPERWLAPAAALLALLAWSGSLVRSGFSYDDREVLAANPVVQGHVPWTAAFERDYWHHRGAAGHYRPLAALALRADRAAWGERALGLHATNVVLHVLVVVLAAAAARALALPAAAGIAVFAVHPALADSVAWISGRTSMLAAAGGLAGLLLALHGARARSSPVRAALAALGGALAVLLGLLGKEDAIVFAAVVPFALLRVDRRAAAGAAAGALFGLAAYLALRAHALGSALPHAPHAPLAAAPLAERLEVGGRAVVEALRLVAWPAGYPPSYGTRPDLAPATGAALRGALGLLLWLALAGLGAARSRRAGAASAAAALLVALAAVPMLQIVPSGEVFAPRFLYLPLLLASPLVHALWVALGRRRSLLAIALALGVLGAWERAGVYADRGSHRRAVLAHRPGDAAAWNDLGLHREEQGDLDDARAAWLEAARLDPGYSRPWTNLARRARADGDLEQAEALGRRAVRAGPENPVAHLNLGSLLLATERPAEAAESYARAVELAPGLALAWRGLARARLEAGDAATARAAVERALALDPSDRVTLALRRRIEAVVLPPDRDL